MRRRLLPFLIATAVATACGGSDAPPGQQVDTSGPLLALPTCGPPPSEAAEPVEGLIVPDGTVVTQVTPQKPLTNVAGYVGLTPVQFENSFTEMDGITILQSENE